MKPRQFSLRQLLLLTTILCPVLALPGGPLALLTVFCWVIFVGVTTGLLVAVYRPLYVAIAGRAWAEEGGRRSPYPASAPPNSR